MQSTGNMARHGQYPLTTLEEQSYFIQPTYNFGPQFYGADTAPWAVGGGGVNNLGGGLAQQNLDDPNRMDSLTFEQQQELMRSLEETGLDGVDELFGLESQAFMFNGLQ